MPDRLVYETGPDTAAATQVETDRRAHDARRETAAAALDIAPRSWMGRDLRNRSITPDAEHVRASLAKTAVIPSAIHTSCPLHHAPVGEPCWPLPVAICGPRLSAWSRELAAKPDPGELPQPVWRRQHHH